MAALVKYVSADVPTGELIFARSFFALPPLLIWTIARNEFPTALRTHRFSGHLVRGAFGVGAMGGFFIALRFLPLPDLTAIQFVAPLITLALASVMLGETVGVFRWSAVGVGFLGVLLILWPYLGAGVNVTDERGLGAIVALFGAALTALAMVQVRQLTATETTAAIVFYFSVTCSVFGLATVPFGWIVPDLWTGAILVSIGLLGGVGQILLTQSYRYAPASVIAPFDYTAMIWSLIIGYLMFSELPIPIVLVGASIVIAAGLFVIWRERQLGIQRDRQRRAGQPTL